jgi:hypothetical protein
MGLTISLLQGAWNMILHFNSRPDEEWIIEHR